MADLKELERVMRGTKGIPIKYSFLTRERRQFRQIREFSEKYQKQIIKLEEVVRSIKKKEEIKETAEEVRKEILKSIDFLYRIGYRTQISEMMALDRLIEIGNLLVKFKAPESEALKKFIKVFSRAKDLTKTNWDRIKTALGKERESYAMKITRTGILVRKTPEARAKEIELLRGEAAKCVWNQRHALKVINKIKEKRELEKKMKKDEKAAEEYKNLLRKVEENLKKFSDAMDKEMTLITQIIMKFVIQFVDLRDKLGLFERAGFAKDEKIHDKFGDKERELSEMSETPAFRMMGVGRI